jgi:hypothetical protein
MRKNTLHSLRLVPVSLGILLVSCQDTGRVREVKNVVLVTIDVPRAIVAFIGPAIPNEARILSKRNTRGK